MLKVTQVKFVVGLGGTKSVETSAVLSSAMIEKKKRKNLGSAGDGGDIQA